MMTLPPFDDQVSATSAVEVMLTDHVCTFAPRLIER